MSQLKTIQDNHKEGSHFIQDLSKAIGTLSEHHSTISQKFLADFKGLKLLEDSPPSDELYGEEICSPIDFSDEELEEPIEDQPLPIDASPTALSPGYIADFDLEEDEEDEVEEEHLAPAYPSDVPIDDHIPSS
ncbi:hypothetical protein Tco_1153223 [Tanacetum coccineum]